MLGKGFLKNLVSSTASAPPLQSKKEEGEFLLMEGPYQDYFDVERAVVSQGNFIPMTPSVLVSRSSRSLTNTAEEVAKVNYLSKKASEVMDFFNVMLAPPVCSWLIASNKRVYDRTSSMAMSAPFFGVVLEGEYLLWPGAARALPALFMPLASGLPGSTLVMPDVDHAKLGEEQATEEVAYILSPSMPAVDITPTVRASHPESEEGSLFFSVHVDDIKRAVAFYHESFKGESKLLSYFYHLKYPESVEVVMFRFKMPACLSKECYPKSVGPFVRLKLSPYCRIYEGHQEI